MLSDHRVIAHVDILEYFRVIPYLGVMADIGMTSQIYLFPEFCGQEP